MTRTFLVSVAIGPKYEQRLPQMRARLNASTGIDVLLLWSRYDVTSDSLYQRHAATFDWMERTYRRRYRYRPYCALFKPVVLWRAFEMASEGDVVLWIDA